MCTKSPRKFGTRLHITLTSALIFLFMFASVASASLLGDVNNDGVVNVQDVSMVARHVLGVEALTEAQRAVADVNQDGAVDILDVTLLVQRSLGLIDQFPIPPDKAPTAEMMVHFIDVGQGDSILIETSSKNILIDGGNRGDTVVNYFQSLNIDELDIVIGTHPHADHIGGLINVMENITVKEVIDPGVVHTTKTFEDYLDIIDKNNIIFTEGRAGMSRDLGDGITMNIIHPSDPEGHSLNNASIVARVVVDQISFLFAGDAESEAESEMLVSGYTLNSTILKVGHHGSRTSTSQAFLNAVSPEVAVIMCGLGNTYGHPHQETFDKLLSAGVDIFRTDLQGTITITTDGQSYQVNIDPHTTEPPEEADPDPDPEPTGSVNINTASFEDLQLIIHIGPDRAQQIIDLRPFDSLDGLLQVSGISPSRLQDIKDQGIAYVE